MPLFSLETWELLSYVVTVVGFPFAIAVFWLEQRKERQNEREEIFLKLLDEYNGFVKVLVDHADLRLMTRKPTDDGLTPEQQEKRYIIFDMLITFFERAYILVYDDAMDRETARMWRTWEDYIDFWLAREDFRALLPGLLAGEDPEFSAFMQRKLGEIFP